MRSAVYFLLMFLVRASVAALASVTACASGAVRSPDTSRPIPEDYPAAATALAELLEVAVDGGAHWEVTTDDCRLVVLGTRQYRAGARGNMQAVRRTRSTFPLEAIVRVQVDDAEHLIRVWTTKNAVGITVDDTHGPNDRSMDSIYTIAFEFTKREHLGDVRDALVEAARLCGARPYVEQSR